jgi:hypothetical protein
MIFRNGSIIGYTAGNAVFFANTVSLQSNEKDPQATLHGSESIILTDESHRLKIIRAQCVAAQAGNIPLGRQVRFLFEGFVEAGIFPEAALQIHCCGHHTRLHEQLCLYDALGNDVLVYGPVGIAFEFADQMVFADVKMAAHFIQGKLLPDMLIDIGDHIRHPFYGAGALHISCLTKKPAQPRHQYGQLAAVDQALAGLRANRIGYDLADDIAAGGEILSA